MKTINWKHALLACSLLLCSCSGLEPEAKINKAIPLSEEAQLALMLVLKQADGDQQDQIEKDQAIALKLRALTCAKGYSPSWFTSDDEIRKNIVDRSCFSEEDKKITNRLHIVRAGLILAMPSLGSTGSTSSPTTVSADGYIEAVSYAASAPVAMLKVRNGVNIIDLHSGKSISKHKDTESRMGQISPNGRLYTLGSSTQTKIIDSETGDELGEFPRVSYSEFFWLDNRSAIFFDRSNQAEQKATLLDFTTGNTSPADGITTNIVQVFPDPNKAGDFILLLSQSVLRISLSYENGPRMTIKQTVSLGRTWSDRRSGITADGKTLFRSSQDLELISLDTMQPEKLSLKPYQFTTITATADPDSLIISGQALGSADNTFLLSLSRKTISPIDETSLKLDRVQYIPFIRKNAVLSSSGSLILIDKITAGAPKTINQFVGEMVLAQSELKLRMFEQQQAALSQMQGNSSSRSSNPSAYASLYTDAAYRQVRPEWEDANSYRDAAVQAVGVYQGKKVGGSSSKPFIQVRVRPSGKPIVLVLSSYEAVRWVLIPERGARIGVVLISGYESSDVIGAGQARTIRLGSHYAYERGSASYAQLDGSVYKFLGKRIGTFQGLYEGENFSVGGSY